MPEGFAVPGYQLLGRLGGGPSGETWLARSVVSGELVALKRLRLQDAAAAVAVDELVAALQRVGHEHLLPLRRHLSAAGTALLVQQLAERGSLGRLLAVRERVDPGEAVTSLAPVAEALAAVHDAGLVHGHLTPANVLYTVEGRPLLADTGLLPALAAAGSLGAADGPAGRSIGAGGPAGGSAGAGGGPAEPRGVVPPGRSGAPATVAADVFGLAAIGYLALAGRSYRPGVDRPLREVAPGLPPGLAAAVTAGLQADPADRPTAAELADLCYAAAPPAPVRFPAGPLLDAAVAAAASPAPGPEPVPAGGPPVPAGRRVPPGVPSNPAHATAGTTTAAAPARTAPVVAAGAHLAPMLPRGRRRLVALALLPVAALLVLGLVLGLTRGVRAPGESAPPAPVAHTPAAGHPAAAGHPVTAGQAARTSAPAAAATTAQPPVRPTPARSASSPAEPTSSPARPTPAAAPAAPAGLPATTAPVPGSAPSPAADVRPAGLGGTTGPPADTPAEQARWWRTLAALDQQRLRALAAADRAALARTYAPGATGLAADLAQLTDVLTPYYAAGYHLEGLGWRILSLSVRHAGPASVDLEVLAQTEAYALVEPTTGERVGRPAGPVLLDRLRLAKVDGRWVFAG